MSLRDNCSGSVNGVRAGLTFGFPLRMFGDRPQRAK
jgi:hypothetical protein